MGRSCLFPLQAILICELGLADNEQELTFKQLTSMFLPGGALFCRDLKLRANILGSDMLLPLDKRCEGERYSC